MDNIEIQLKKKKFFESAFLIVTFSFLALWCILLFVQGRESQQYNVFMGGICEFFGDIFYMVGNSAGRDGNMYIPQTVYTKYHGEYLPISYLITYLFGRLIDISYVSRANYLDIYKDPRFMMIYILFLIASFIILYQLMYLCKEGSNMIKFLVSVGVMFSAPVMFAVERGNFILQSLICIFIFLMYYNSASRWKREVAYIALAVAAALKIIPALFGIMLLYEKRWKDAIRLIIYGIAFSFIPFIFVKGGFTNIPIWYQNVISNINNMGERRGCSLYDIYRYWEIVSIPWMDHVIKAVAMILGILFCTVAPFHDKKWQRWLGVILTVLLVSPRSGYYYVIYLFPALLIFLNEEEHEGVDLFLLALFLVLMNPVQGNGWMGAIYDHHFVVFCLDVYMLVICIKKLKYIIRCKSVK